MACSHHADVPNAITVSRRTPIPTRALATPAPKGSHVCCTPCPAAPGTPPAASRTWPPASANKYVTIKRAMSDTTIVASTVR